MNERCALTAITASRKEREEVSEHTTFESEKTEFNKGGHGLNRCSINFFRLAGASYKDDLFDFGQRQDKEKRRIDIDIDIDTTEKDFVPISTQSTVATTTTTCEAIEELIHDMEGSQEGRVHSSACLC